MSEFPAFKTTSNFTQKAGMKRCRSLSDYACFVAKIRENMKTMSMEKAVRNALEKCISENILKDFLIKQKAEVIAMSIYEYNEEYVKKVLYEDGYDSGRLTVITASVRKMHSRNIPPEEMADLLDQEQSVIDHILKLLREHPEAENEDIAKMIVSEKE